MVVYVFSTNSNEKAASSTEPSILCLADQAVPTNLSSASEKYISRRKAMPFQAVRGLVADMRHILMGDSVIGKVSWIHNADAVIPVFMLVKLASKRPRLYQAVWLGSDLAKRDALPAIHKVKRLS
jgi:hypothetical protein